MTQHSSRRRRWWCLLIFLDNTIAVSLSLLGGLLVEIAGLNQMERSLILTSTGNNTDFEKIAGDWISRQV